MKFISPLRRTPGKSAKLEIPLVIAFTPKNAPFRHNGGYRGLASTCWPDRETASTISPLL
jgi:hypothetical protein